MKAFAVWLLGVVLVPVVALAQAPAADLNTITGVQVSGGTVSITGTKKPNFTTFTMTDPPRLVIDISEAVFSGVPEELAVGDGTVTGIRTASYGSDASAIARVLIGYEREVETDIQANGNQLVIRVLGGGGQAVAQAPAAGTGTGAAATGTGTGTAPATDGTAAQSAAAAQADRQAQEKAAAEAAAAAKAEREAQEKAAAEATARAQADAEAEKKRQEEARAAAQRQEQEARASADAAAAERKRQEEEARASAQAAADERKRQDEEARAAAKRAEDERRASAQASAEDKKRQDEEARAAAKRAEDERRASAQAAAQDKRAEQQAAAEDKRAEREAAAEERRAAAQAAADEKRERQEAAAEEKRQREADARAARERQKQESVAMAPPRERSTPREVSGGSDASVQVSSRRKTMTLVGFQQQSGASRVFIRTNEPVRYTVNESGGAVVLELENTRIDLSNNTRPLDTSFFSSPVTRVEADAEGRAVRVTIQLRQQAPYQARQEGNVISLDFQRTGR